MIIISKYDDIKRKIAEKNSKLSQNKAMSDNYRGELQAVATDKARLKSNYDKDVEFTQKKQLEEEIHEGTKAFYEKLKGYEAKRVVLLDKKKLAVDKITPKDFEKFYKKEIELTNNISDTSAVLLDSMYDMYGKRFSNALYIGMSDDHLDFEYDSIKDISTSYDNLVKKVRNLTRVGKFDLHSLCDKLFKNFELGAWELTPKAIPAVIVIGGVLSYAVYKALFPFLFALFIIIIIYNIYSSLGIYACILETKSIEDNTEGVMQSINKAMENKCEKKKGLVGGKYDAKINKLNSAIEKLQNKIISTEQSIKNNFLFDPSNLQYQLDTALSALDMKEESSNKALKDIATENTNLSKELSELNVNLEDAKLNIKDECYPLKNINIANKLLYTNFLLSTEPEPTFFNHSGNSTIIIYPSDLVNDMLSVIELMFLQLASNMNPFSFSTVLYDTVYMGANFQKYASIEQMFAIKPSSEDIVNHTKTMNSLLRKRIKLIKKEHKNIGEYNKAMLDNRSVPESYILIFNMFLNSDIIKTPEYTQLLLNGGDVGIVPTLFVSDTELDEMIQDREIILKNVSEFYVYNGSKFGKKSKDFMASYFDKVEARKKANN